MEIKFVDAENADLLMLAAKLDEYYFEIVGEVHKRYAKYNDPHLFGCRAVVYIDGKPAGCGCWKRIDSAAWRSSASMFCRNTGGRASPAW